MATSFAVIHSQLALAINGSAAERIGGWVADAG
jgi:hypothetical protein